MEAEPHSAVNTAAIDGAGEILPDTPPRHTRSDGAIDLGRVKFSAYARYAPINAAVTLVNSLIVSTVLASALGVLPVLPFFALHALVAFRTLRRPAAAGKLRRTRRDNRARLRGAILWGTIAGAGWGAGVLYLPHVPPSHQLVVVITAVGMMGGASTTLAAVPAAAAAFICTTALPYAVYLLLQPDLTHVALTALALVYTLSMLGASRLVYRVLIEEFRTREEKRVLGERFREERAEWQEITETSEGFALFDEQGHLLLWNQNYAVVLGLPPEMPSRGLARQTIAARALRPADVQEGRRSVDAWVDQLTHLEHRPEGAMEDRLVDGRMIRSSARRTRRGHIVTVHTDVTRLKEVEAELKSRERDLFEARKLEAVGKLAGGVAHDFNNLLTVMQGYAGSLRSELVDRPNLREEASEIVRASERAAGLTRQLLAFSRKQPLCPQVVDLNEILEGLRMLLGRVIPDDLDLTIELCPRELKVRVDPHQLEQVVINLVVNARDAVAPGGRITVGTRHVTEPPADIATFAPASGCSCVFVTDTGTGMSPEVQERIFEPFFTTKEIGRGTGLGLSTAYGIVKQSGGELRVSSEPGRGSTFEAWLPLTDEPGVVRGGAEAAGAGAQVGMPDPGRP